MPHPEDHQAASPLLPGWHPSAGLKPRAGEGHVQALTCPWKFTPLQHLNAGKSLGISDHVEAVGEGWEAQEAAWPQGLLDELRQGSVIQHPQQATVQLQRPAGTGGLLAPCWQGSGQLVGV